MLADADGGDPELILIATGSEVALALAAHEELSADGVRSRVVSLPCWELFERQDEAYRDEVLPPAVTARVSVEEASTLGWDRYVGPEGERIGMHTFGSSAPLKDVQTQVRLHAGQGRGGGAQGADGQTAMREASVKPTQELHEMGQSLWLDNITRTMLGDGTLQRYVDELSVTGLTSNPTIFDKAISGGDAYDEQIAELRAPSGTRPRSSSSSSPSPTCRDATEIFAPIHARTDGVDGWASLEVSPLLADDAAATIEQAAAPAREGRPRQPLHQDPGHRGRADGDRGVDLRRRPDQRHPALLARAVPRLGRGLHAGARTPGRGRARPRRPLGRLDLRQPLGRRGRRHAPAGLRNQLGIAVARRAYRAYRELLDSERWQSLANEGARPQRLLFASTGTKDPDASDTLYVEALAAPFTINTMPENTLHAFADHGEIGEPLSDDGGDAEQVLSQFAEAGVEIESLAARLQEEGKVAFDKSWRELLGHDRGTAGPVSAERAKRARLVSSRSERSAKLDLLSDLREYRRLAGARAPPRRDSATATSATSSTPTPSAASGSSPTAPGSTSTSRRTGSSTRRCCCSATSSPSAASTNAAKRCSPASTSTSPRTGPCSTSRCGCRAAARWSSTASTSSRRSTRPSTGWPTSPSGSGAASGSGTPASRSATSSTSGSAAPTSAR